MQFYCNTSTSTSTSTSISIRFFILENMPHPHNNPYYHHKYFSAKATSFQKPLPQYSSSLLLLSVANLFATGSSCWERKQLRVNLAVPRIQEKLIKVNFAWAQEILRDLQKFQGPSGPLKERSLKRKKENKAFKCYFRYLCVSRQLWNVSLLLPQPPDLPT